MTTTNYRQQHENERIHIEAELDRFPRTLHEAIRKATPLHLWRYIDDDYQPPRRDEDEQ
jgi:hypothetical protein